MNINKTILLFSSALLLIGCPPKNDKAKQPPGEEESTTFLRLRDCNDSTIYCFSIEDISVVSTEEARITHAVVREFFIDEDGAKFLGGTNPSLSFHLLKETLVVKSRLKSNPLPPQYKPLNNASSSKTKLPSSKAEEEFAILFTNRRLDLPFILVETFRGKAKIAEAVENLLNGETETRTSEFRFQRKGQNDHPFTQLLTLNLNYTFKEKDLPKSLVEYLKN